MQLYAVLQGMHLNPNDIEKFNIKGQESIFTQKQTEKTSITFFVSSNKH